MKIRMVSGLQRNLLFLVVGITILLLLGLIGTGWYLGEKEGRKAEQLIANTNHEMVGKVHAIENFSAMQIDFFMNFYLRSIPGNGKVFSEVMDETVMKGNYLIVNPENVGNSEAINETVKLQQSASSGISNAFPNIYGSVFSHNKKQRRVCSTSDISYEGGWIFSSWNSIISWACSR